MNTILKGDTSGDITLAIPETFDFTSNTVMLTYQGIARKFENVKPGASVTFSLSAEETSSLALGVWPVEIAIIGTDGTRHVLNTSGIRIRVTDVPSEAYSGDVIPVNARGIFAGISDLPEEYTDRDVYGKIREILKRGGAAIMIVLCALPALGDVLNVQTARKDAIYNYEQIVTNVTFDASAITPGNYEAVSNAAMNAVQPTNLAAVATSGAYSDLSGKPTIPMTAADIGATTPADVTAAIREQSLGGIWDESLQVWWTPRMRNGRLNYEATTNVNLNAED